LGACGRESLSVVFRLVGVFILLAIALADYEVWSHLIGTGLSNVGALVGYGLLALLSIPITALAIFFGLFLLVSDN
jgi:hypothetical protein